MDLLRLRIESPFRNLEGLEVIFNEGTSTHVFIGNNGSGKSSVLEALSSIFSVLYVGDEKDFEFSYWMTYQIDGVNVWLKYVKDKSRFIVKIDNQISDWNTLRSGFLPNRVICNYSGEETRMAELFYNKAYKQYIEGMKNGNDVASSLKMVLVDKKYWQIIFLVMLACRNQVESFNVFFKETVGLKTVDNIIIQANQDALNNWKENSITYYFRQLLARRNEHNSINEFSLNPENNYTPLNLFLNLISVSELITKLTITYNGSIDASYLSEGEKKLMTVLFILEALADEKSLVLLDEPDSHIHVAKKCELVKYLSQTVNRENIVTSHSPTLTSQFDIHSVRMFDRLPDGKAAVVSMTKQDIVSKLTQGIWTLQQQQLFLASNDDILLVEGKTDEIYLRKALEYLQNCEGLFSDMNFCFLPCGGADGIQLLKDRFTPKEGQMMIALFDNDTKGWKSINSIFGKNEADKFNSKSFQKARKTNNLWVAPFPTSNKKAGNFNIEDYFPRRIFTRFVLSFKSLNEVVGRDTLKNKFSQACEDSLIKGKDYKRFRAVFDLIEKIKEAEIAGKQLI